MRLLLVVVLIGLAFAAWGDGFTTYGTHAFASIRETDQVAVINLAPGRVTLDMFIGIDRIPRGETVTYILPFWQKPEGFTMATMAGKDFREQNIIPLRPQFRHEIRRANRNAVGSITGSYLIGGLFVFTPTTLAGVCVGAVIFPTLGRNGEVFQPYTSVTVPGGSAELYQLSAEHDLQALVAKAGFPAKYATVLRRYRTPYYAIMRLHASPKAKEGQTDQGLHFHFFHQAQREEYTYTYPLGTGGAWANPILFTEVYAYCSPEYYLTATAPTLGDTLSYSAMHARIVDLTFDTPDADSWKTATASVTPPVRYPTAWHRAYSQSNPTGDITLRFARRPFNPLFTFASAWRDSDWMAIPFILLGFIGSLWLSVVISLRKGWIAAGKPETLWSHGRRFAMALVLPLLVNIMLVGLSRLIWMLTKDSNFEYLTAFPLIPIPIVGIFLWRSLIKRADRILPPGTMASATYMGILWYLLLLPLWLAVAWGLDLIVK